MAGQPIDKSEIAELSRMARIAFAVRCAQRVTPLLKYCWPDIPEEDHLLLTNSLDAAADASSAGKLLDRNASYGLGGIKMKALAQAEARKDLPEEEHNRLSAAFVVVASIQHAVGVAEDQLIPDGELGSAEKAYESSAVAGEAVSTDAQAACLDACRQDLEKLKSIDEGTTDFASLGDLWPGGYPSKWPST